MDFAHARDRPEEAPYNIARMAECRLAEGMAQGFYLIVAFI
jgi:hypothetical protein